MSINPGSRIACVLVGLPGTSKTLVAQKVCRYLQWLGIATKVFNVGNYRRKLFGGAQPHSFFDPANPKGEQSRKSLREMIYWFRKEQGVVAVFDGTNSTRAKRDLLLEECRKNDVQVMFIESVCEDEALRLAKAIETSQQCSPDYEHMQQELALQDFQQRVRHFEAQYETITEKNLSYIKLIDAGSQVIVSQIQGYVQSRIVYYLMNLHIKPRNIYFSRHGESLYNVMGLLGGDSDLSARGKQYARALPSLVATHIPNHERLTIWTSTKRRTIATAKHLPNKKLAWQALDELEAGRADGLTYNQVEELFPEDFANRDNDKYNYRYQEGESYRDVVARLEPVIMDLERTDDILIIGHQAILRCLYAYFMNYSHERLPYIKIPLHTVIQLSPGPYACEEKRFKVDIEAVDTHRPKPKTTTSHNEVKEHVETVVPEIMAAPASPEAKHGLHAAAEAAADKPMLCFRDSIHPHADSVSSRAASPAAAAPAATAVTAPSAAPVPVVKESTKTRVPGPTSIDLPSPGLEQTAQKIAEAMMQANALESQANPAVGLNLDQIATPVPEQETGGVKGPLLGLEIATHHQGTASASASAAGLVATPPMSPVPTAPSVPSSSPGKDSDIEEESLTTPIPGVVHASKRFSPLDLSDQIIAEGMVGYESYGYNSGSSGTSGSDSIDSVSLTATTCV
ncbi:Fructose-2,6-bisphosphatase [Mortierella alpina]|uniref:fructose-2,6-bisphosphate 2-phosphatase n=1 Tax=Mortierella alpina TaxID=64518 RepID=A0A9P6IZ36_MORAP|nr:Fructose-2,6-bisphosphatase [Mortierella alpina]